MLYCAACADGCQAAGLPLTMSSITTRATCEMCGAPNQRCSGIPAAEAREKWNIRWSNERSDWLRVRPLALVKKAA